MGLQLMKERIKQSGVSLYDEQIKDAQNILSYSFKDDVSYNPNIVYYKSDKNIPIKMYDQKYSASYGYISKFLCPHNISVNLGELLYNTIKNEYWLCIESYDVSGIHIEGKLGKCSRFIKWQEQDGTIREIPVISRNATQYNNGEYKDEKITLGSDQIILYTQLNDYTKILDHGIKFFMDENKEQPSVYELTKPDTVDYSYMGVGMMSMMLTERAYTPTKEELELGVCNYTDMDSCFTNKSQKPDKTTDLSASITGSPKLKIGIPRTYSVDFTFQKKPVKWNEVNFKWNIISDFKINQNIHENKIELNVDDERYIDSSFLAQIILDELVLSEIEVTVIPIV